MEGDKSLEDALDALLIAILNERRKRERDAAPMGSIPIMDAGADDGPIPTRMESAMLDIVENPVEGALTFALRQIGEHLFKVLGSTDAMLDLSERVCDRHPETANYRSSIIDHKWDGIGNAKDMWVC